MEQSPSETVAASYPPRKKRGRPKKAEKLLLLQSDASAATKDVPKVRRKKKKGFSKSVPVASGRKKRQQGMSPSSTKTSDSDAEADVARPVPEKDESAGSNVNVGQQVHGVVDGMFDAGYLVTVRVGDTETVFRGVVFGPGLSLPLNTENDVAPKLKKMNQDDETHDVHAVPSSGTTLNEAGAAAPVTSTVSTPAILHAPVNPASILASSSILPASEGHRAVTIAGSTTELGVSAGYSPVAPYRSPLFVRSPLQNASGGFYYAPAAHTPNPNGNHGSAYFPAPNRAFPGAYAFQYPTRDQDYHAGSSQFGGPAPATAASVSPSPNMQGTLPPRA